MIKIKEILIPFGKSGNIYLIGALTQGVTPVLLTPFLTRTISTTEFGQITILNSVALILSILFSLGIPIVISRSYILEKNQKNSIDKLINIFAFIYILISIIFYLTYKIAGHTYLLFISIGFLLAIYQIGLPTFRARNQSTLFATYSILNTLLPILFILLFKNKILTIFDLFFLGVFCSSLFSLIFIYRKSSKTIMNKFILKAIKTSLPILPHMLGMIAFVNIDKVLFGYLKDESIAGYLQIIMLVGLSPIFILSALNHAWLNQILEQLSKLGSKTLSQINKTVYILLLICTLMIVTLTFTSSKIVEILNPNIIMNTNIFSSIILTSVSSLLYVIYLANTHILTWNKNFWVLGISTPFSVLIQAISIYLLIDRLTYLSAAIGIGVALTFQIFVLELFNVFKNNHKILMKWTKLFPVVVYWSTCFIVVIITRS